MGIGGIGYNSILGSVKYLPIKVGGHVKVYSYTCRGVHMYANINLRRYKKRLVIIEKAESPQN